MKIVFLLLSFLFCAQIFSQNKYIVNYDKLNDSFSFEQVHYNHGKETKTKIEKPKLKFGDVVVVNAINTNEFVFKMNVLNREIENDNYSNPVSRLLEGFPMISGLNGTIGGLLDEMSYISSRRPDPIYNSRGGEELTENESFNAMINEKTIQAYQILRLESEQLKLFNENTAVIYAEDKTLSEIKSSFSKFKETFNLEDFMTKMDELNEIVSELDKSIESTELEVEDQIRKDLDQLKRSINRITNQMNDEENPIDTELLEKIQNELEDVDFQIQHTFIVGPDKYGNVNSIQDIREFEYIISFDRHSDEEDYDYKNDNTQMVRTVSLKTDSPNLPQWTSGVGIVTPFNGIKNYSISEDFWGDSIYVRSLEAGSSIISVTTNIMYEFRNDKMIQPHVSAGMALGILNFEDRRVSFILGGGIRFAKFQAISLNAGISFSQAKVLNKEYNENTWFATPEDADPYSNYESLFKNKFLPGYYFGLNIHF